MSSHPAGLSFCNLSPQIELILSLFSASANTGAYRASWRRSSWAAPTSVREGVHSNRLSEQAPPGSARRKPSWRRAHVARASTNHLHRWRPKTGNRGQEVEKVAGLEAARPADIRRLRSACPAPRRHRRTLSGALYDNVFQFNKLSKCAHYPVATFGSATYSFLTFTP